MCAAHIQNCEPKIEISVCSSCTILGLKNSWHWAARLCARQTINYKVRSYKAKRAYWESQVQCVAEKSAQQFTYSRPLDIRYLGKFLKNTLKNDRKIRKKYIFDIGGLKHHRCPEESFMEWKKYWVSVAKRDKSIQMTEMRKGKKQKKQKKNNGLCKIQVTLTDPKAAIQSKIRYNFCCCKCCKLM